MDQFETDHNTGNLRHKETGGGNYLAYEIDHPDGFPDVRGDDDVIADPAALPAIYLSDARLRRLARNKRRRGRK